MIMNYVFNLYVFVRQLRNRTTRTTPPTRTSIELVRAKLETMAISILYMSTKFQSFSKFEHIRIQLANLTR